MSILGHRVYNDFLIDLILLSKKQYYFSSLLIFIEQIMGKFQKLIIPIKNLFFSSSYKNK